ncbi:MULTISPECIES: hypothetical protein [Pseudanabaena]|uniref:hypothetical protein n=1 Tax=Pseudanabaena TaxID=1152 RepID=UPI00247A012D|nr:MULTISPECIES: hypothetical protein [Pseudanabaena]MEA5489849.1 hypothetical protein [Pseudanabaena sp. CCNP1317]WGS74138.1 hypothetical protein OA858_08970 [Pseudanabaena galeata CCNP1313]
MGRYSRKRGTTNKFSLGDRSNNSGDRHHHSVLSRGQLAVSQGKEFLGKGIRLLVDQFIDQDLKKFAEEKINLLQKTKLSSGDQDLLIKTKDKLTIYLLDVEKLLAVEKNTESGFSHIPKYGQNFTELTGGKINLHVAQYVFSQKTIQEYVEQNGGMSLDNRRFLNQVKANLEEYQEDIKRIERRLN